MKVNIDDLA